MPAGQVRLLQSAGRAHPRSSGGTADRPAGDSAGLPGRMDITGPTGPSAGHGTRCARAQAVSLSPALARDSRQRQVRAHARIRSGATETAWQPGEAPDPAWDAT